MSDYIIKVPDIGEGIAEVELVAWHVKVGDLVREDQGLADVMTDKAAVEVPSPVAGMVLALGGEVGKMIAVGAELIRLEVEGAGNVKAGAPAAPARPAPPAAPAVPAVASQPAPVERVAPEPVVAQAAPVAKAAPPHTTPAPMRAPGDKPIASPAVRRRAWELGIELQFVHGSGPAGRIAHEDLDVYLASRGQPAQRQGSSAYAQRDTEDAIPVIGLRRKIAQKMQ
ncbi:MAG: E3 binding domain-containing protein, partial [Ramlibacter sp.]|nr:E3 binding domain-containing protein [Ramlibacter sp.]